ncbi:MAG: DUF421 domain-containing protein, partial [Clostridia bacterium]|nr:DUF421 domain-containing protein [Clostridia bacterium]
DVAYAIFETNGKICVVEKPKDENAPPLMPLTLIVDGEFEKENLKLAKISEEYILEQIKEQGIRSIKNVLYMDVRQNGLVYLSQKKGKFLNFNIKVNGESW